MKTIAMLIATLALVSNAYAAPNKVCKPGKDLEYKCEPRQPKEKAEPAPAPEPAPEPETEK